MSSLIIATNIAGLNAHRSLKNISYKTEKVSERLSSGYKINSASDDAAGLAISEKMRNQIKGLNMASKNSMDAISLIQTAEGAMQEAHEVLKRIRELTIQAANDTNVTADREKIGVEINQLLGVMESIYKDTEFNDKKLMDGTYATVTHGADPLYMQVGANENQGMEFGVPCMNPRTCARLGLFYDSITLTPRADELFKTLDGEGIIEYLSIVDSSIDYVSDWRASLGAVQNRLEHTIKNLDISAENLAASESRIRDADMAREMMEFTKGNVLSQAGISMLAQANQNPNNVLTLLR